MVSLLLVTILVVELIMLASITRAKAAISSATRVSASDSPDCWLSFLIICFFTVYPPVDTGSAIAFPILFSFQVMLEGVEGEKGSGYSKKEAQQQASKDTLQRLKREPQFIDAIFAAKTERTKMEEMPAMAVPDTEQEENFIIEQDDSRKEERERRNENTPASDKSRTSAPPHPRTPENQDDDFDLSDLSVKPKEKTREDIIAEAEAAAFAEAEG